MSFHTDKQTLDDLQLLGRAGQESIYSIFNRTTTRGGAEILEEMFRYPLSDVESINLRSSLIHYFAGLGLPFPFPSSDFDAVERYMANTDERSKLNVANRKLGSKLMDLVAVDTEKALILKGIYSLLNLLKSTRQFIGGLDLPTGSSYQPERDAISALLAEPFLAPVLASGSKPGFEALASFDQLLRFRHRDAIHKLLRHLYQLDVYVSVAGVARDRSYTFPQAFPQEDQRLSLEGVYHPLVKGALGNTLHITPEQNIVFLTGANMAGKSTFMKSLGIALYLGHMGFPVPAKGMSFAVRDGIYTSINVPDNLGMGASHFYAEVLRVKKVAQELSRGKSLFIIFDELFRGTNVKDAHEATVALTIAVSRKPQCMFVVSTHIIEAGQVLRERSSQIQFVYLPTHMEGTRPVYTYQLEQGITEDRHGMVIINNEGILEMIRDGVGRPRAIPRQTRPFLADRQTLDDLNLLGKFKQHSIFSLFNQVQTKGGEQLLEHFFQQPLTDPAAINQRSGLFRYFGSQDLQLPFERDEFIQMENYLSGGSAPGKLMSGIRTLQKKIMASMLRDEQYLQLQEGVRVAIRVLRQLKIFVRQFSDQTKGQYNPYSEQLNEMEHFFQQPSLRWLDEVDIHKQEIPWRRLSQYDQQLRQQQSAQLGQLLSRIYELDLFITVSKLAISKGFGYATAEPAEAHSLQFSGFRHPQLDKGIANNLELNEQGNILFLTGANMAGKSTLMKALGINVYLAHMGFPVAADDMTFSVKEGLYSSINVSDNLNQGLSHYYAEVLRVKQVAKEVSEGRNLIVIFDELFKGTNVKDAYDATLAVTEALAQYPNCFFIISTHIIEVGEVLKQHRNNLQFAYMPTLMEGKVPRYTYRMQPGITSDRQGMMIIENEGIMNIL